MPRMNILNAIEQEAFESAPAFNRGQRDGGGQSRDEFGLIQGSCGDVVFLHANVIRAEADRLSDIELRAGVSRHRRKRGDAQKEWAEGATPRPRSRGLSSNWTENRGKPERYGE
jgi:hypothetical protein